MELLGVTRRLSRSNDCLRIKCLETRQYGRPRHTSEPSLPLKSRKGSKFLRFPHVIVRCKLLKCPRYVGIHNAQPFVVTPCLWRWLVRHSASSLELCPYHQHFARGRFSRRPSAGDGRRNYAAKRFPRSRIRL